MYWLFIFYNRW